MPKGMKIKTSVRNHVWTVQKKVGGRWGMIVDDHGPIMIHTRKIARDISREFKNLDTRNRRSYRVVKYSATK